MDLSWVDDAPTHRRELAAARYSRFAREGIFIAQLMLDFGLSVADAVDELERSKHHWARGLAYERKVRRRLARARLEVIAKASSRACRHCGSGLPAAATARRLYCDARCRGRAHRGVRRSQ